MNAASPQPTCPVCGEPIAREPVAREHLFDFLLCECKRCGAFRYLRPALKSPNFNDVRHLVSAWIQRQNRAGVRTPLVPADTRDAESMNKWFEQLKYAGFPQTVTEKLDALLKAYGDIVKDGISTASIATHQHPELISLIAARDHDELTELSRLLHELNYIEFSSFRRDFVAYPEAESVIIKADGWRRIDEMSKAPGGTDSALIAMWFHEHTAAYREACIMALRSCGYKPLIVDQSDFNGFIMDQILALMRTSRFVVADFTCLPEQVQGESVKCGVRGGVYWEAGVAFGMNKPVIHTCEDSEDSRRRLHFDVTQYRTLYWRPDELTGDVGDLTAPIANPNFAERLAQHILGTIGRGNYTE